MNKPFATILMIGLFFLSSCQATSVPATARPIPSPTLVPSQTPNSTLPPTLTLTTFPSQTPSIPYPTASAVKANAVAFLAENALWVVNIDGSGEKKLTDLPRGDNLVRYSSETIMWSPNGQWIAYIAANILWLTSYDGAVSKQLFAFPKDTEWGYASAPFQYVWSPDSSKIAYALPVSENHVDGWASTLGPTPTSDMPSNGPSYRVGMIEIATGDVFSNLVQFKSFLDLNTLSWLPDSRRLLFVGAYSLEVFEISQRKMLKEIRHPCFGWGRSVLWSPDGNRFVFGDRHTIGSFQDACIANLADDSIHPIKVDGVYASSSYNWDKTGNALYFITRSLDASGVYVDERLMRYDVRTEKAERLLSIRAKETNPVGYGDAFLSLSPNKSTIYICWADAPTERHYILLNLQTMSTTKFTTEFPSAPAWAADGQNLISVTPDDRFQKLNLQTHEIAVFSGRHYADWAVAPVPTFP